MNERDFQFPLLGSTCHVMGADDRQERWLRYHWQFPQLRLDPRPFEINIRFLSAAPFDLPRMSVRSCTSAVHGAIVQWQQHDARRWSTTESNSGVQFWLGEFNAGIDVWQSHAGANIRIPLHVAMCEAVRATGLAPLHAAVVAREQHVIGFAGSAGTGKSTTVLTAMAAGWQPLSEDFAWLDPANGRVYGWDRGIHLTKAGADRFRPQWKSEGWHTDFNGKLFRTFEDLGASTAGSRVLTGLTLLQRDDSQASRWEHLSNHDAVRMLFESAGVPLCTESRDHFAAQVGSLMNRLELRRLILGRTPLPL